MTSAIASNNIFIVGLPRSGTTVLQRLLATDSRVLAKEETWFLPLLQASFHSEYSCSIIGQKTALGRTNISNSHISQFASIVLEEILTESGKSILVEKTPRNYLVDFWDALLGKNFLIVRNPRDIILSHIHNFYAGSFKHMHGYFVDHTLGPECCITLSKRCDFLVIKYEELRNDDTIHQIKNFSGLNINLDSLALTSGEIGDKDNSPRVEIRPAKEVHGIVKKLWINATLKKYYRSYANFFGYKLEYEEVNVTDVFRKENISDAAWIAFYFARKLISYLYCKFVARREPGFYL